MSRRSTAVITRAALGNLLVGVALLAIAALLVAWQPSPLQLMAPDDRRLQLATLVLLLYLAFCAALWWQRRGVRPPVASAGTLVDDGLAVFYASQTGRAEQLAQQTVDALRGAGIATQLLPLLAFDSQAPHRWHRALFIVSTTGEGDAPDSCYHFVQQQMCRQPVLAALHYGLLGLGDRGYRNFCAFGRDLDHWLQHCGAQALFDRVEVDNSDPGALRHWQQQLSTLAGEDAEFADWTPPAYQRWQLVERKRLNPGSLGQAVFRIALRLDDGIDAVWRAGDVAEIGPCNNPADVHDFAAALGLDLQRTIVAGGTTMSLQTLLSRRRLPRDDERQSLRDLSPHALLSRLDELPHREYSIASLPQDGQLELLLRQTWHSDGRLGHGSGWLSEWAPLQATIALRIRRNAGFHLADDDPAPLLMIGNGTGIAGLRAHWRARVAAGHTRNWLLFGERQRSCDYYFGDELERLLHERALSRVDAVFSRDGGEWRYVQDALRANAETVRTWIGDGASVLVCGSLKGMAPAVDVALRDILGEAAYERFAEQGRYRRDVY